MVDTPIKPENVLITENSDVIIPPPDLKQIIETTAQYVAKKGLGLEKQIAQRQAQNQKFYFLKTTSPYHAFYRKQIAAIRKEDPSLAEADESSKVETTEDPSDKSLPKSSTGQISKTETASKLDKEEGEKEEMPTKKPLLERIKQLITAEMQPREEHVLDKKPMNYDVSPPPGIVPLDIEIIKLTAQFVAANGRAFLATVSNREQKNPQFAFLKPTNMALFLYFSDLVQAYQRILSPPENVILEMTTETKSKNLILERLLGMAEFERREKRKAEKARKNREDEKREMSLIDWHSFVILETIDFNENDDDYLPPPSMTIEEINETLEAEKRLNENIQKVGNTVEEERPENPEESSDEDVQMMEVDEEVEPHTESSYLIDREKLPTLETKGQRETRQQAERNRVSKKKLAVQKCTVCGQNIPVDEIAEHIRVELLDPKWSEQRKIAQSKMRDATLAEATEMDRNLRNFVQVRKRPFDRPTQKEDESIIWSGKGTAPHYEMEDNKKLKGFGNNPQFVPTPLPVPTPISGKPMSQEEKLKQVAEKIQRMQSNLNQNKQIQQLNSQPNNGLKPFMPPQNHPFNPSMVPQAPMMAGRPFTSGKQPQILTPMQPSFQTTQMRMNPPMPSRLPPINMPPINMPPINMPPINMPPIKQNMMAPNMMNPMQQNMMRPNTMNPPMQQPIPQQKVTPQQPIVPMRSVHQRGPLAESQLTGLAANTGLIDEKTFLSTHPRQVVVQVSIPLETSKSEWNFKGQTLNISLKLNDTVKTLKTHLERRLNGMPQKKMKLKIAGGSFLKDSFSLAYYNVTSDSSIEVGVKARGGRK